MKFRKHLPLAAAFAAGAASALLAGIILDGCRKTCANVSPAALGEDAAANEPAAPEHGPDPAGGSCGKPEFRTARIANAYVRANPFGKPEIHLEFNYGVSMGALKEAAENGLLTITPAVAGISVSSRYWSELVVGGDFKYGETYEIKMREGVELAPENGGTKYRTAAFSGELKTGDTPRAFEFIGKGSNLSPAFGGAIAFRARNLESVALSLHRVLPQNIPLLLSGYIWKADYDAGLIADDPVVRRCALRAESPDSVVTNSVSLNDFSESGRIRPGIYVVQAGAEPANDGGGSRFMLVQCSDIGVVARMNQGRVNVWTVRLSSGTPLADVLVEIYGANGKLAGSARSDARGVASFDVGGARRPLHIIAKTDGGDCTLVKLQGGEIDDLPSHAAETFPQSGGELDAFLFSDRGIYRHGDRIFLHGLVRNAAGSAPSAGSELPLELRFIAPDGKPRADLKVAVDGLGHFEIEGGWKIPEDALSGVWTARLGTPGKKSRTLAVRNFSVEAFVPPQIKVTVEGLADSFACDELPAGAAVRADYLFGSGAAGLKTEVELDAKAFEFKTGSHPAQDGWHFNAADKTAFRTGLPAGVTGADGVFAPDPGKTADACAVYKESPMKPAIAKIALSATVTEPNGRKVTETKTFTKAFVPWFIGVRAGAVRAGEPLPVEIELVKQDGTVAEDADAEFDVTLSRICRHYDLVMRGNGMTWNETIARCDADRRKIRIANGKASLALAAPEECEEYELSVVCTSDAARDQCTRFGFDTWNDDDALASAHASPTRLRIKPDKEKYAVGDTASVEIRAPFDGIALVTLQRDRELEQRVAVVSNKVARLDFEIGAEHAPSVEFSATLVRPLVKSGERVVQRAIGAAAVQVFDPAKDLGLALGEPSVKILPVGSEVTVALDCGDPEARAAVFLVDEGIINLTDEPVPDPVGAFGRIRWSGVRICDTYSKLMRIYDLPLAKTEIGGDDVTRSRLRRLASTSRRFVPLALEKTDVRFDAGGHADVTFRLPEFSGAVRIAAVAWTRRASGSASANARIAPDVVSAPDAPRFLAPGDATEIIDVLHNSTDREITVDWKAEIDGAEPGARTSGALKLAPKSSVTVRVPVKVPESSAKPVSVKWTANGRVSSIEIPVRPAVPPRTTVEHFDVAAGAEIEIKPDEDAVPGTETVSVSAVKSPYDEFTPAVKYLADYRWRCTEQCVSRALPFVDSHKALLDLGRNMSALAESCVNDAIETICGRFSNLGVRTWDDWGAINPRHTAYAGYFLAVAASEGYDIPEDVLIRTADMLKRLARSRGDEVGVRALALLALETLGKPDRDTENRLFDMNDGLDAYSRAVLSLAFRRAGDPARANATLAAIKTDEISGVGEIAWTIRATLASGDGDEINAIVMALRRRLLDLRPAWSSDRSWCSTTDNAAALLAAGDMVRRFPPRNYGAFAFECTVNGATRTATNSVPKFGIGDGCRIVSRTDEQRAFLVKRTARPRVDRVKEFSNGVAIERRFFTRDGVELDPAEDLRANTPVVVALTVTPKGAALNDLVIEEYLPAGIEASAFGMLPECGWIDRSAHSWVAHKDVRDDAVVVFSGAVDGARTFYYAADVVTPGEFTLPPPQVEHMYLGNIRANGKPSRIRIGK